MGSSFSAVNVSNASAVFNSDQNSLLSTSAGTTPALDLMNSGTTNFTDTVLAEYTNNNTPFSTKIYQPTILFGIAGALPVGVTGYLYPGTNVSSTAEVFIRMPQACILTVMTVRAVTPPGTGQTDTYTVRKNSTNLGVTISLTAAQVSASYKASAIPFAAGDTVSVQLVSGAATASSDVMITLSFY